MERVVWHLFGQPLSGEAGVRGESYRLVEGLRLVNTTVEIEIAIHRTYPPSKQQSVIGRHKS